MNPGCQPQLLSPLVSGGFTVFTAQSHRLGIPHTQASWPGDWPCALCTHSPCWPLCDQVSESQCGKRKLCCFTNESIPRPAREWINTTNDYSVFSAEQRCPGRKAAWDGFWREGQEWPGLADADLLQAWEEAICQKVNCHYQQDGCVWRRVHSDVVIYLWEAGKEMPEIKLTPV